MFCPRFFVQRCGTVRCMYVSMLVLLHNMKVSSHAVVCVRIYSECHFQFRYKPKTLKSSVCRNINSHQLGERARARRAERESKGARHEKSTNTLDTRGVLHGELLNLWKNRTQQIVKNKYWIDETSRKSKYISGKKVCCECVGSFLLCMCTKWSHAKHRMGKLEMKNFNFIVSFVRFWPIDKFNLNWKLFGKKRCTRTNHE